MSGMTISHKRSVTHQRRSVLPSGLQLVIVLMGVVALIAIALPTYLSVKARANSAAARANIRSAVPSIEAYYALTSSSYAGLNLAWLRQFDPGVKLNDPAAEPAKQTATSYCVSATVGGKTWYKAGPQAPIISRAC
jgi:Tfp pilus assembly protein PilE